MKKQRILFIVFIILIAVLIAVNYINKPVKQTFEEAYISVKAPKLEKNTANEISVKENIKDNISKIAYYQAENGGIAYLITYAEYSKKVDLTKGIKSVTKTFKDCDFKYETIDNEINSNPGTYIEGTFTKNSKIFGIKNQLIKKDNSFWQILVIYPDSKKNEKKANDFIKSIQILK